MREEEMAFKERETDSGELPTSTDEDDCPTNSLLNI